MNAKNPHTESDQTAAEAVVNEIDKEHETGSTVADSCSNPPTEIGGRGGLSPTRYGDWEKAGRCIDF